MALNQTKVLRGGVPCLPVQQNVVVWRMVVARSEDINAQEVPIDKSASNVTAMSNRKRNPAI
eukprot:6253711-Prorocentrum_lima.AAC.1